MLAHLDEDAVAIHSEMMQSKRLNSLEKFRAQRSRILVATDVASRGLDIPSVELVINYDIPRDAKDYVHRVGRTARAGRGGLAVSLVTQYDIELIKSIEALIGKELVLDAAKESDALELMTTVSTARRLARMEIAEKESSALEKTSFTNARDKRESRKRRTVEEGGGGKMQSSAKESSKTAKTTKTTKTKNKKKRDN
mmetsp:Transcript_51504/g.120847  ORF Transcript_51504/g.120847 Transcript_51504/m.120847 type:complete len:197 (+) Transcript_51504:1-591(+)